MAETGSAPKASDKVSVVVPLQQRSESMAPPPRPLRRSLRQLPRSTEPENTARSYTTSSPSTSSASGNKRKLAEMSLPPTSSSKQSKAPTFSSSTKNAIARLSGDVCWHCGSRSCLETAHVLEGAGSEFFTDLTDRGLANIRALNHKDNGVRLCVLCHRSMDDTRAYWVFIPADLQFFIDSERDDHDRRCDTFRATGRYPKRICPSSAQYKDHKRGSVDGSLEGWYYSYMRKNFFHENISYVAEFSPGRSPIQPNGARWHGDPMAALWRGFMMNGWSPETFPDDVADSLTILINLYKRNDRPPTTKPGSIQESASRQPSDDHDSHNDGQDQPPPGLRTPDPSTPSVSKEPKAATTNPQSNQPTNRRHSRRLAEQRERQAAQERQEKQDEVRRLLQDPPNKRLRREIVEGIWKWGPLISTEEARLAYLKGRQGGRTKRRKV